VGGALVSSAAMGDPAEKLLEEAIKLPPEARRAFALRVLASVADEGGESAPPTRGVTASWETIAALCGVVYLGGNAVEDCDRLYEGEAATD
jgi:hypothetical protein